MNTRKTGKHFEDKACDFLTKKGYKIMARNWHWSNKGEIDIVAADPKRFGEEYIVFVEVKARDHSMKNALEAISKSKIKQLQLLAKAYIQCNKLHKCNISFDFIAISKEKITHLQNIL